MIIPDQNFIICLSILGRKKHATTFRISADRQIDSKWPFVFCLLLSFVNLLEAKSWVLYYLILCQQWWQFLLGSFGALFDSSKMWLGRIKNVAADPSSFDASKMWLGRVFTLNILTNKNIELAFSQLEGCLRSFTLGSLTAAGIKGAFPDRIKKPDHQIQSLNARLFPFNCYRFSQYMYTKIKLLPL